MEETRQPVSGDKPWGTEHESHSRQELSDLLCRMYPPSLRRFVISLSSYNPGFAESTRAWIRERALPPSPLERLKECLAVKRGKLSPEGLTALRGELESVIGDIDKTDLQAEGSEKKYLLTLIRGLGRLRADQDELRSVAQSLLISLKEKTESCGPWYSSAFLWSLVELWEEGKTGVFGSVVEDLIVRMGSVGEERAKLLRYTLRTKQKTKEEIERIQHLRGRLKETGDGESPEDRIKRAGVS